MLRRLLDVCMYLAAIAVLGVGGFGVYGALATSTPGSQGGAERHGLALPSLTEMFSPQPFGGKERVTIMLVGSDDRANSGSLDRAKGPGRADTLMVMFLNPKTHRLALLSFPRDLRVNIPGHHADKVNHAYHFGGVPLTRQTVEGFLGIKTDYYARCDFQSFLKCAEMLGGCDLEVPDVEGKGRGMNYDDNWGNLHIHLRPGYQHLTGEQCMGFVRYRHGDSDFNRTQRQQQFLKAMFEQKLKVQNLPALTRAAGFMLHAVDTDLDWRSAADLTRALKQTPSENLFAATIPMKDAMLGGVYFAMPQEARVHELLAEVDEHLSSQPAKPCSYVLTNGTGKPQLATDAVSMLKLKGFDVAKNATARETKRTQVLYQAKEHATAVRIANILRVPSADVLPTPGTGDARAPITVVLGKDFYGAAGPPPAAAAKAAPGVKAKPNPFAPKKKAVSHGAG